MEAHARICDDAPQVETPQLASLFVGLSRVCAPLTVPAPAVLVLQPGEPFGRAASSAHQCRPQRVRLMSHLTFPTAAAILQ